VVLGGGLVVLVLGVLFGGGGVGWGEKGGGGGGGGGGVGGGGFCWGVFSWFCWVGGFVVLGLWLGFVGEVVGGWVVFGGGWLGGGGGVWYGLGHMVWRVGGVAGELSARKNGLRKICVDGFLKKDTSILG